jgi:hypothetical protein
MTIVNVGLSRRFAPAEMLEKLAVPSAEPRSHPHLAASSA